MTRRCFFVDRVTPADGMVTLEGETAFHAQTVLRLKPGDSVELRDGAGQGWQGVVAATGEGAVRVRLEEPRNPGNESSLHLTLAMAYSRADRMDLVVRQATELGMHRFVAFRARRSQYGLTESQAARRKERWIKIAQQALCQCGRSTLPAVHLFSSREEWLESESALKQETAGALPLVAVEHQGKESLLSLWTADPFCRNIVVAVGPEGGWAAEEMEGFLAQGFHGIHLGPRILRLETAALALVASVQLLWGDLGQHVLEGGQAP